MYSLLWKVSPLLGQVPTQFLKGVTMQAGCAHLRPSLVGPIVASMGFIGRLGWPWIHSFDVVLFKKTDGQLGRDEVVRYRL